MPPRDPAELDVETSYERNASFDKDIPGMVAERVEIWQHGQRIVVRTWSTEDGAAVSAVKAKGGTIGRVAGTVVHFVMDDGTEAQLDLTTRQLV